MNPRFFATPAEFRAWLAEHHETETELWVGFHKRGSGLDSITWPESVDAALCFGWIDGVRKSLDDTSYVIRFTPRQRTSTWSAVNVRRFEELRAAGLVAPAGQRAYDARRDDRTAIYSHEQRRNPELGEEYEREFRANAAAWADFTSRSPSYRRSAIWWVISAKRPETQRRRLARLIEDSANGREIGPLARPGRSG